MIDMNKHDLKNELSHEKLTKQLFLFKDKNDLDGKLVETVMPFKDIEAFQNYLESIIE